MAEYLMVKNFERHQHYKDRSPPWIKLYNAVMDDDAFLGLTDASRGHLMLIWLLASRRGNKLPNDAKAIGKAIQANSRVDLEGLLAAGFLLPYQDASTPLAEPTQDASALLPRAREEREKRERREEAEPPLALSPSAKTPAQILAGIKSLAQESQAPGHGTQRFIRKALVEELGADVAVAYDAIGGADAVLKTPGEKWAFLVRDFERELSTARRVS